MSVANMIQTSGMSAIIYDRADVTDRFGQPAGSWVERPSGVPCRVSYEGYSYGRISGEIMGERYINLVMDQRKVFVLPDVDVDEANVLKVVNSSGEEILAFSQIDSVQPRYGRFGETSHKEIIVSAYRHAEFQHAEVS